jgi:hypothetical protein
LLGHPGERTLHGDVHAVPTGDDEQVCAGDVAALVGPDVLDQACRGRGGGPDVTADEQQAVDGAGQALEQ